MKIIRQLFLWGALFGAFCLLFFLFGEDAPYIPESTADVEPVALLLGDTTVSLSLRDYLIGAVAGEMPAEFGEEALKAQAVAIRTYLLSAKKHHEAHVCADSRCCLAYKSNEDLKALWGENYEENFARIATAVDSTAGEYITYMDKPIQAVFHASSEGSTEDSAALWGALPYLVSVETPEAAETVSNLVTKVTVSPEEMAHKLGLQTDAPPPEWVEDIRYSDSGRVKGVLLAGKAFTGAYLRSAFFLRSTDFILQWDGENFIFTVTGHGHGVGMSQYGANLLAVGGYTYQEILAHYYSGTELMKA